MARQSKRSLYGLLSAIARSGECTDCGAIEGKLHRLGFSPADACEALADADDRAALLAICHEARMAAREEQRIKDSAASRQLVDEV